MFCGECVSHLNLIHEFRRKCLTLKTINSQTVKNELSPEIDAERRHINAVDESEEFLSIENVSIDIKQEELLLEETKMEEDNNESGSETFSLGHKEDEKGEEEETVIDGKKEIISISTGSFISSEHSLPTELKSEKPLIEKQAGERNKQKENRHHTCPMCFKSIIGRRAKLTSHMQYVHEDRANWKYGCSVCGKRFMTSTKLKDHLARHTGAKDFTCSLCNKAFYDKTALNVHQKLHATRKIYKCEMCSTEYKRLHSLNIHKKRIHNVGTTPIPKRVEKFACDLCGAMFRYHGRLQVHIRSHSGEKPFKCESCEKHFSYGYYLMKHVRRAHS